MNNNSKILRFERNAEYYYRRFEQCADTYNYLDALVNIRQARELAPQNEEYEISMAEVLTEMGIYEESNAILLPMYYRRSLYQDDVTFNMGCNFYGMHEMHKAQECFAQYVTLYPNGDLVYDASDMLEMMSEEEEMDDLSLTPQQSELIDQGKYFINCGDYDSAVKALSRIAEECPGISYVENNLALAHYCNGDLHSAITTANNVLKSDPQNVHALCNLALFHFANGVSNSDNIFLSRLSKIGPADSDDSLKLLLTYCELGEHRMAYDMLRTILSEKPYDARVLFLAGICSANVGDYKGAFEHFVNMLKLDPMDSIALYYKEQVRRAMDGSSLEVLKYNYQVPVDEIRDRLCYLNGCLMKDAAELTEIWKKDDCILKRTVLWGIYLADPSIKRLSLELLNLIGDEFAINTLKRYLLKESEPNEVKNDIFIMLHMRGVPMPYIAYINGKVAEVNLRTADEAIPEIKQCHKDVMQRIADSAYAQEDNSIITQSADILRRYCAHFSCPPVMRNQSAWAAALLYTAYLVFGNNELPPLSSVLKEFDTEEGAVNRCLRKIRAALTEET